MGLVWVRRVPQGPGIAVRIPLSLLFGLAGFGVFCMTTWRQEFERLSAVEREEIGKWKGGASNIPALRQAMEAVSEFLRRYEQADLPERDQEMPN